MKLKLLLLIPFALLLTPIHAQTPAKPSYTGVVKFASGGFDGYDPPKKGDSVLVYITDGKQISFEVLSGSSDNRFRLRHLDIVFKDLILTKKAEYKNIVSIDKEVPTGNYN